MIDIMFFLCFKMDDAQGAGHSQNAEPDSAMTLFQKPIILGMA
jgi:hypothetical protein